MDLRTIQYDETLLGLWEELVYSEARLLKNKLTADLAKKIGLHLKEWEKVSGGQLACWRAEIVAQAGVDEENEDLDETVADLDHAIYSLDRDTSSPRYKRYFTKAPSHVIRLGLESELGVVRTWPDSLAGEPEKALQDVGKRLAKDVAEGDAAVAERRGAQTRTKDHRVRDIVKLVDAVNATRRTIYGELIQRGEKAGQPKNWASRFFRKSSASAVAKEPKAEGPAPEGHKDTPAPPA
jgi:hypothetical protein